MCGYNYLLGFFVLKLQKLQFEFLVHDKIKGGDSNKFIYQEFKNYLICYQMYNFKGLWQTWLEPGFRDSLELIINTLQLAL